MNNIERIFLVYAVAEKTVMVEGRFSRGTLAEKNVGDQSVVCDLIDVAACENGQKAIDALAMGYCELARDHIEAVHPQMKLFGEEVELYVSSMVLLVDYDTLRPVCLVKYGEAQDPLDFEMQFDDALSGKLAALVAKRSIENSVETRGVGKTRQSI
jgi:hypothetical protein